jgi:hypothetical protein
MPHYFSVPLPDGVIWAAVGTAAREDAQSRIEADDPIWRQTLVAYHGCSVRDEISQQLPVVRGRASFWFQPRDE